MTFVITGLTPPPYFGKKMTKFFFLVLDQIWVNFGKKYFLLFEKCKK